MRLNISTDAIDEMLTICYWFIYFFDFFYSYDYPDIVTLTCMKFNESENGRLKKIGFKNEKPK